MFRKSIFFAICLALGACGKLAPFSLHLEQTPAATPHSTPPYDKVAAKLDSGGVIYLYWSAERILGEIDKKLAAVRDQALQTPGLASVEKEKLTTDLNFGSRLVLSSGLQDIKAFGLSSKAEDSGLFLNKSFIYVPNQSGFLWDAFAKPAHDLTLLNAIPTKTEAFAFCDVDLNALWQSLSKELANSKVPAVTDWVQKCPQQIQMLTGLTLSDLLASLGNQVGVVITLDPKTTVRVPLGIDAVEIYEPAAALIWTVKDDKLFDRLDALFSLNTKVQKTDEPNLKMRVLPDWSSILYVTPTLARVDNYLIISTSDKLVRAIVDTQTGKIPGLKSSPEFTRLSTRLPTHGNGVTYASKVFQATIAAIKTKFPRRYEDANFSVESIANKISSLSADVSHYSVTVNADDGIQIIARTTKDINKSLGDFVALPAYCIAQKLVDEMKRNRDEVKIGKIKENLKKLDSAKEQIVSENELEEGQMLNRQDVEPFLTEWPKPILGETYEVGVIGQPPYATAPVDLTGYPAGTHIEP